MRTPTPASPAGVVLPYVDIGRHARLTNVVIDRGVVIPPGLVVGEDPEADARRFRRTSSGVCLITQPMIDPAENLIRALSVVSEVFPLIKTGGLADVAGALPAALAPLEVELRTLVPGYPRRAGRADRGRNGPSAGSVRRPGPRAERHRRRPVGLRHRRAASV